MKRSGLIITGGEWNGKFASSYCNQIFGGNKPDVFLAVDRGIEYALELRENLDYPITLAIGDMDSVSDKAVGKISEIKVKRYPSEKDDTDTALAVEYLADEQVTDVLILGATGGRIDHMLANLRLLVNLKQAGINATLVDERNRIRVVSDSFKIKKEEQFGKYVSFLPVLEKAEGVTLSGFRYPLTNGELTFSRSIGVSNEIISDVAEVSLKNGMLYMIESKDK